MISVERAHERIRAQRPGRRPWHYRVSVALPHYETPETLPVLLGLLGLQTVPPYVLLVDTGSRAATVRQLERLRRPWVEVHYLRAHGYRHTSGPVTTALDLCFALCRTEYLFLTHTDAFPVRRDLLEWLLTLCRPHNPVVGYEQSPRPGTELWRNVVSHTCTMLHMPTLRAAGASWSFERYWEAAGAAPHTDGFPDTEQPFDRCLRRAGIFPYIIGHEDNGPRFRDGNLDHVRSTTCLRKHAPASARAAQARRELDWALRAGRERLRRWRHEAERLAGCRKGVTDGR